MGKVTLPSRSPGSPLQSPTLQTFPPLILPKHTPPIDYLWPIPPHSLLCKVNESARQEYPQRIQRTLPPVHLFHPFIYTFWIQYTRSLCTFPQLTWRQTRQNPCLHGVWLSGQCVHFNITWRQCPSFAILPSYFNSEIFREGRRCGDRMIDPSPVTLKTQLSPGGWKNTDLDNESMECMHGNGDNKTHPS